MNHSTEAPAADHPEIGLMFGMSTGKDHVHDLERIPLGAARYMLAADLVRRRNNAEGTLFVGNRRERAKAVNVNRRIQRLRDLAAGLMPQMIVMTEADLDPAVLDRVLRDMDDHGTDLVLQYDPHRDYKSWQTKVVGATMLRNGYTRRIKYGIEGVHDGEARGERQFDTHLVPAWGIECQYGPVDRDVDGNWAVPYLLNTDNPNGRVCIPLRENGIGAELDKIKPGVRRIALDTWSTTAGVILGHERPEALEEPRLAAEPLTPAHLEPVLGAGEIDDAKQKIGEALKKLIALNR